MVKIIKNAISTNGEDSVFPQIILKLPMVLVQEISRFLGTVKYRSGKWMIQIDRQDKRLTLYDKIPKPQLLYSRHTQDYKLFDVHITFFVGKKKRGVMEFIIFSNFFDKKSEKSFDPYNVNYISQIELDLFYTKEEIDNNEYKEIVYLCKPTENHKYKCNDYSNKHKMVWIRR